MEISDVERPIVFSMRLSQAEDIAMRYLAELEGLPKSIYIRRSIRLAIQQHESVLPAKVVKAIHAQQRVEA